MRRPVEFKAGDAIRRKTDHKPFGNVLRTVLAEGHPRMGNLENLGVAQLLTVRLPDGTVLENVNSAAMERVPEPKDTPWML